MVKPPAVRQDAVRADAGLRITAAESQRIVREAHRVFLAKARRLDTIDPIRDGDDVF
jgi:hypothetical protein